MDSVKRIFVEKKAPFAVKAKELKTEIESYLGINSVTAVREFIRYDVENISEEIFETACNRVFSEPPVDILYHETIDIPEDGRVFGVEYLPGQFDQRADSALQCIQFLKEDENPIIKTAITYMIQGNVTDEEFEKAFFFNACRGAALNELYISPHMMNEGKWQSLANCINWQKANYHILKNAMFIGGNPTENNVYCYASWTENGEGIIALRNPANEAAPLTLTLNKLMGCPETLHNVRHYNVLNKAAAESSDVYNYNDKINLTLAPFEIKIIQFGEEDRRFAYPQKGNDFTITFETNGADRVICENDDVLVCIKKGYVNVTIGTVSLKSHSLVNAGNYKITVVREKNRMVKIYINNKLDCSGYDKKTKAEISTNLASTAEGFEIINTATPYNEIMLPAILKKSRWKKKKEGTF